MSFHFGHPLFPSFRYNKQVFVSDNSIKAIQVYSLDGIFLYNFTSQYPGLLQDPRQIDIFDDILYVIDCKSNKIYLFDIQSQKLLRQIQTPKPCALALLHKTQNQPVLLQGDWLKVNTAVQSNFIKKTKHFMTSLKIVVGNEHDNFVRVYNYTGVIQYMFIDKRNKKYRCISRIFTNEQDNIFISDWKRCEIRIYNFKGEFTSSIRADNLFNNPLVTQLFNLHYGIFTVKVSMKNCVHNYHTIIHKFEFIDKTVSKCYWQGGRLIYIHPSLPHLL